MYWHWQNLDEDRRGQKKGRGWRHGRAWIHNTSYDYGRESGVRVWPLLPSELRAEWSFLSRSLAFGIGYSRSDEEHQLHFCPVPRLAALWFGWHNKRFQAQDWRDAHVAWDIRHHHGALWWSLGANPMGGPRTWREGGINWMDLVFGRARYSNRIVEVRQVPLPLPEGTVTATVEEHVSTWTRRRWPRWPLTRRRTSYTIKPERPAPIPGKGENAWDIDDDAIFEMSCAASGVEDAIGHFIAAVLRDRRRHGGSYDWQARDAVGT